MTQPSAKYLGWYPAIVAGSCPSVGYNKKVAWTKAGQTYNADCINDFHYCDAQLYVKESSATSKAIAAPTRAKATS